jgi:hypothetical protein
VVGGFVVWARNTLIETYAIRCKWYGVR